MISILVQSSLIKYFPKKIKTSTKWAKRIKIIRKSYDWILTSKWNRCVDTLTPILLLLLLLWLYCMINIDDVLTQANGIRLNYAFSMKKEDKNRSYSHSVCLWSHHLYDIIIQFTEMKDLLVFKNRFQPLHLRIPICTSWHDYKWNDSMNLEL